MELTGLRGLAAWIDSVIKPLSDSWRVVDNRYLNMIKIVRESGCCVMISGDVEADGKKWIHFSMSYPNRMPTWTELVRTKEELLGEESLAIQVIPPRSKYVNLNPHVLHFFLPYRHDPLPDFTRGRGCI